MHFIYYTDSDEVRQKTKLYELIKKLPNEMHERAKRYKFEKDAFNFALGRLILQKGMKGLGIESKLEDIMYADSGKPFLNKLYFNISHTDGLVACAFSKSGELGLDIEKFRQVKLSDFKAWFTEKEMSDIHAADSAMQKFYWYWTRKESIIKALGIDLSYLHKIEIDATKDYFLVKNKKWHLYDIDLPKGYIGSLCSESELIEIHLNQIPVNLL